MFMGRPGKTKTQRRRVVPGQDVGLPVLGNSRSKGRANPLLLVGLAARGSVGATRDRPVRNDACAAFPEARPFGPNNARCTISRLPALVPRATRIRSVEWASIPINKYIRIRGSHWGLHPQHVSLVAHRDYV